MVSTLSQHSSDNHLYTAWIGRSIGDASRYLLEQRLGGGGMGEVFLATDTRLGKSVALKLLKESLAIAEDSDLRERFERECSICAALKSSHIVQVTDYGVTSEGYPFYVMEYLQGQTLGELLTVQPYLPIDRACNIMIQVCEGLRLAHEGVVLWSTETNATERIKVVHRDLKPPNIMLIPSALGELVKIIDFGIAKIRSLKTETTVATSLFLGTCHYASPEQFSLAGDVDERADIYSLGMMLYEMLTGVDPFGLDFRNRRVSNDAWFAAHSRRVPLPLQSLMPPESKAHPNAASLLPALEKIVMRCLEKRPSDRFASVTELSEALQAAISGVAVSVAESEPDETQAWNPEEISAPAPAEVPLPAAPKRSNASLPARKWLLMGGAVLALAFAVSVPRLFQLGSPSTETPSAGQTAAQTELSLNTHRFSLLKTLAENPAQSKAIWSAILTPDGRTLISGGEDRDPFNNQFFPVKVWSLSTAEVPNTLNEGHTAPIRNLSLSQDGRILASASADQTIKIWDVAAGKLLQTLQGHTAPVWSVALSRDGKTLVSGSQDNTLKIWDVQTGALRHTLTEHTGVVYSVALSPDGKTIASGSEDFTVKIWNAETGELIRTLSQPEGHRDVVRAVAISPDGKLLASGSWEKNVKLWDLQTGKWLRTYEGHQDKVVTVAFVNNRTLASGSLDNTIRIWDTQTEKFQEIPDAHANWVLSVTADPSQTLVSSSNDKTIKLWQWEPNSAQ
ncbi:serine/threonine protein kinase [Phormidium tenue FACHB-886]|nr:serine/threonine protein kinase [Phormidium tenue FACHB-886]